MNPILPCLLALALGTHAGPFPGGDALAESETLLASGRADEARARLEARLAEDAPAAERPLLLEALARCHRALGRPWDAEAAYGAALEARPAFFEAALGRGQVFLDLALGAAGGAAPSGAEVRALAADAARWFAAAAAERPGEARASLGLARARVLDLDFAGAAASLRALLEKDPGNADAHHALAEALRGAGDRAGAARAEADCLALDPGRVEASARLVSDLAAAGDRPAARRAAREALVREPGADAVYRALWEAEAPDRDFAAVEEVAAAVLAAHPDDPKALYFAGHAQLSSGRRDAALDTFRRKAALEPRNPQPRLQVGRLLVARSELAGAEKAFEEALPGLPEGGADRAAALEGLFAVGAAHGMARRYGEAERVFRRLTELDPAGADYRVFLGLSLRRLGRRAEAEQAFLAAVERAPFDGSPRNELGLLYLGSGRSAEAAAAFEASAAEDPRFTPPLENLGSVARAAGRLAEALGRFREAHRRAAAFRDEDDRLKFRRYLDTVAREAEAAAGK